jgi:hypothetical protein
MATPPRDPQGNVIPHDDPDILQDDGLLRYIDPQNHMVWDENIQKYRVSSGAFCESYGGGMSVDLERPMNEAGLPSDHRKPATDWGIAQLKTGMMRSKGLQVGSDPLNGNAFHGAVWGIGNRKKLRKQILESVVWICEAQRA